MGSGQTAPVRCAILEVMLCLGSLMPIAGAQAERLPGPPVAPGTKGPLTAGVDEGNAELIAVSLGIVGLILVMVAVAHAIDERRRRAAEAVPLQAQISDALRRERRLARLPVAATVHIPVWRGAPPRIEMCGQVSTADLRQAVRHVAEQEASRTLEAFHIDDRIAVVLCPRVPAPPEGCGRSRAIHQDGVQGGAAAMGFSWVKISRALELEHMVTVQIHATDTKPEWDALECLWDICAHSRGVRVPDANSTGNALEMVRVSKL